MKLIVWGLLLCFWIFVGAMLLGWMQPVPVAVKQKAQLERFMAGGADLHAGNPFSQKGAAK